MLLWELTIFRFWNSLKLQKPSMLDYNLGKINYFLNICITFFINIVHLFLFSIEILKPKHWRKEICPHLTMPRRFLFPLLIVKTYFMKIQFESNKVMYNFPVWECVSRASFQSTFLLAFFFVYTLERNMSFDFYFFFSFLIFICLEFWLVNEDITSILKFNFFSLRSQFLVEIRKTKPDPEYNLIYSRNVYHRNNQANEMKIKTSWRKL